MFLTHENTDVAEACPETDKVAYGGGFVERAFLSPKFGFHIVAEIDSLKSCLDQQGVRRQQLRHS